MPKGKPNPRPEGAPPRVIPHSQSVLYRTIKKALPSGIYHDGLVLEPKELLRRIKAAAETRSGVSWGVSDLMCAFVWVNCEGGIELWSKVYEATCAYIDKAKAKQDAVKFKKAVQA